MIKLYSYVKVPHQNEATVYPVCAPDAVYEIDGERISAAALVEDGLVIKVGNRYTASRVALKRIREVN